MARRGAGRELAPGTAHALQEAWRTMLDKIDSATAAIHDPKLHVPPPTDRGLAEGYRYLLGFVYGSFERAFFEDPELPYFRRAVPPVNKATIDNADNLYLSARIDGKASYRVSARAEHFRHWRGGRRASRGRLAPQYVIFTGITQYSGDSGSLAGAGPANKSDTGMIDSFDIEVERDGSFEILVAPERPKNHTGNFIPTESRANYLICRQLFGDWDREYPLELHIDKIGNEGYQPPPLTPADVTVRMDIMGMLVNNQMRYWNEFYVKLLNPYGDQPGHRPTFQPVNDMNQPMFTQAVTGGQGTNAYGSGIFDLQDDEALIIEDRFPGEKPVYTGFSLSNYWGESFDYENFVTSLNDFQARPDGDGVVRYILAHRDPGLANWLDTAGHAEGYMSRRWTYREVPDQVPMVQVRKVKLDDLGSHLPADTRRMDAEQRHRQIAARRFHVRRRYRQS